MKVAVLAQAAKTARIAWAITLPVWPSQASAPGANNASAPIPTRIRNIIRPSLIEKISANFALWTRQAFS
jgi:hypothetical protein